MIDGEKLDLYRKALYHIEELEVILKKLDTDLKCKIISEATLVDWRNDKNFLIGG